MGKLIDLTGKKFNRLIVKERVIITNNRHSYWLCVCECGKEKIICGDGLRSGSTKSCGCLKLEVSLTNLPPSKHNLYKNKFYDVWHHMIGRCYNNKDSHYEYYGGRGIYVVDEWKNSLEKFIEWCEEKNPSPKLQLDRKDNDGPYAPWNCRFVTNKVQCRNRRSNVWIEYNDEKLILEDFIAKYSIVNYKCARIRVNNGWNPVDAVFTPLHKHRKSQYRLGKLPSMRIE